MSCLNWPSFSVIKVRLTCQIEGQVLAIVKKKGYGLAISKIREMVGGRRRTREVRLNYAIPEGISVNFQASFGIILNIFSGEG